MKIQYVILLGFVFVLSFFSCEKKILTVEKGTLDFSVDTVKFDSIFTTFESPAEWVVVRNPTNNNVKVSRIWLAAGTASEFNLIIDGVKTQEAKDIVIPAQDSIHIFIKMKSQEKDKFVEENLQFQIGTETQKLLIRAYVVDAYFYPTLVTLKYEGNQISASYDTFYCNVTLRNDKPNVISGPMYIPQGCKLTIEAGAQVHFTPYKLEIDPVDAPRFYRYYSMLQIAGTLEIKGEAGNPVVLQQTRLQTLPQPLYDYTESPDQWAGIWITTSAQNNIIEHALIKNANIGIRVDSASVNGNPKLTVKYTKVRNMGAYGVLGNFYDDNVRLGNAPAIHMENSSISSCAINTVVIARGGWYDFFNCTFDNTTRTTSKDPTVTVLNAYKDADDVVHGPFDIKTRFVNCAITGKNKHELLLGLLEGGNKQVVCDHSFVKIDDAEYNYDAYFQSVSKNQDVRYNDPYKFDFRPKLGSPLINAGTETFDNTPLPYNWDIRGRADSARTAPYDVGAYEYFEI